MSVRLRWSDTNYGEEGHYIYRSTSPMDPENLPTPIATLGPNVEEYVDATAAYGTTYYYRVGAFTQGGVYVSDEIIQAVDGNNQPLLQLFQSGDYGCFFDATEQTSLFSDADGSVPVVGPGTAVALIDDLSALGVDLSQSTASAQPLFLRSVSKNYLKFDGNDWLLTTGAGNLLRNAGYALIGMAIRSAVVPPSSAVHLFTTTLTNGNALAAFLLNPNGTITVGGRRLSSDNFVSLTSTTSFVSGGVILGHYKYLSNTLALRSNGVQEAISTSFQTSGRTEDIGAKNVALATNYQTSPLQIATFEFGGLFIISRYSNDFTSEEVNSVENYLKSLL